MQECFLVYSLKYTLNLFLIIKSFAELMSVPDLNNLNRLWVGWPVQDSCHTCGKSDSPKMKGENEKVSH